MKKTTAIFLLLLCSCSAKVKTENKTAPDTTKTQIICVLNDRIIPTISYRIDKDTVELDSINENTMVKKLVRDSFYYVPVSIPVLDSLKKPIKDSFIVQFEYIDKKYVLTDFNKKIK